MVGGRFNSESVVRRFEGFLSALRESIPGAIEPAVFQGDFTIESGYETGRLLLDRSPEVTGVFAFNDLLAVGLLKAFRECGVAVPEAKSIIGFDDIFLSSLPGIDLTTIHQEKLLMGKRAMEVLLRRLDGPESDPEVSAAARGTQETPSDLSGHSFAPSLVIRGTTGRAPS